MSELWKLADLETPWCLHVAVTLRVAEYMAEGKTEIGELAAACGASRDALERVLRQLASRGVFEEPEHGRFVLNETARGLLDEGIRLGLNLDGIGGRMAYSWSTLLRAVRTGAPAYHEVFGCPFWEDLQAHPDIQREFDALMGPGHGTPDPEVLVTGGWERVRWVVDVGGGTGWLLAEILKAHPDARGTLVDFPATVERARETFRAAGVEERVSTQAQSFFDPLPAGADLYVLKNVLADWGEKDARAILKRCGEAAGAGSRVAVVGGVAEGEASPELLMLVLVGGRSYGLEEFREVAGAAGLDILATGRQRSGRFVVEMQKRATNEHE